MGLQGKDYAGCQQQRARSHVGHRQSYRQGLWLRCAGGGQASQIGTRAERKLQDREDCEGPGRLPEGRLFVMEQDTANRPGRQHHHQGGSQQVGNNAQNLVPHGGAQYELDKNSQRGCN